MRKVRIVVIEKLIASMKIFSLKYAQGSRFKVDNTVELNITKLIIYKKYV
jgi:hypothetical protein